MATIMERMTKPSVTLVFLGLLAIWEIIVLTVHPSPLILPSPIDVGFEFFKNPTLYLYNAGFTMLNTLLGFALAVIVGVGLAVGIVYSRLLEATLYTAL